MANVIDAEGSIFDSGADVLVCPVNCVPGVMGAGLALEFAKRFTGLRADHRGYCRNRLLAPGSPVVVGGFPRGGFVVFFPTKRHWRDASRLDDVAAGLEKMARIPCIRECRSIAIPALGCGLGGLDWRDVRPLIVEALAPIEIEVLLYAPKEGEA